MCGDCSEALADNSWPGESLVPRAAAPFVGSSYNVGRVQNQGILPTHVTPFEVELGPNSVYYSTSATSSNRPDTTPTREEYFPNTVVQQSNNHSSFDFEFYMSEMDMQPSVTFPDAHEHHMRQPTPDNTGTSTDTERRDAASPLSNELENYDSCEETHMQIDHPEGFHQHNRVATDVIFSDSQHSQAAGSYHTFDPTSARNSTPGKRVASRDLLPLETDNTDVETPSNYNRITNDYSRQRHQRKLIPRTSPLQNPESTSSPQSSKSTPNSARTDLSFVSTATKATLSGSSAVTTPSFAAKSPATLYTLSDNILICRDCGQEFSTPGKQKCVPSRLSPPRHALDISSTSY